MGGGGPDLPWKITSCYLFWYTQTVYTDGINLVINETLFRTFFSYLKANNCCGVHWCTIHSHQVGYKPNFSHAPSFLLCVCEQLCP